MFFDKDTLLSSVPLTVIDSVGKEGKKKGSDSPYLLILHCKDIRKVYIHFEGCRDKLKRVRYYLDGMWCLLVLQRLFISFFFPPRETRSYSSVSRDVCFE